MLILRVVNAYFSTDHKLRSIVGVGVGLVLEKFCKVTIDRLFPFFFLNKRIHRVFTISTDNHRITYYPQQYDMHAL